MIDRHLHWHVRRWFREHVISPRQLCDGVAELEAENARLAEENAAYARSFDSWKRIAEERGEQRDALEAKNARLEGVIRQALAALGEP